MPNELVSTLPKDGGRPRLGTAETLNLCSALFRCTHARTVHACSASRYLLHSNKNCGKVSSATLKAILGLINITIDF